MSKKSFNSVNEQFKYEAAREIAESLNNGFDGGNLTTRQAGKLGGAIGGNMVKKMIEAEKRRMAGL